MSQSLLAPFEKFIEYVDSQEEAFSKEKRQEFMVKYNFLLKDGSPRLNAARAWFLDMKNLDFEGLTDFYKGWRAYPEYLILHNPKEKQWIAVKCSKRGNDVYWHRIKDRFAGIFQGADLRFFNPRDRGPKFTKAVFATLTFDTKLCSCQNSWKMEGRLYNRWITRLRREYGPIDVIRCFESYFNGYIHTHALLIFKDHEFRVFRHQGIEGSTWRIKEKAEFEKSWPSFVDVEACSSIQGVRTYITKYMTKGFYDHSQESLDRDMRGRTLALNWIFRKRSFSISKGLVESIRTLHNSNPVASKSSKSASEWECYGVLSGELMGFKHYAWYFEFDFHSLPNLAWRKLNQRMDSRLLDRFDQAPDLTDPAVPGPSEGVNCLF